MYKLRTGARYIDELFIGFNRNRGRRQRELSNIETQDGNFHLRIMLTDIFGFAERHKHI